MAVQQFTQEDLSQDNQSLDQVPMEGPEPKPKQTVVAAPALKVEQPKFGEIPVVPSFKPEKEQKVLPKEKEQPPIFLGDLSVAENTFKTFATFDSAEKAGATVASSMVGMGAFMQPSQNVFASQADADAYKANIKRSKNEASIQKSQAVKQLSDGKTFQKLTDYLFGSPEEIIAQGGKVNKFIRKNRAGQDEIDPGLVRKEIDRVIEAKGNNGGRYMKELFGSRVASDDNLDVVLSIYKNRDKINKAMPTSIPKDQIKGFMTEFEAKNASSFKSQLNTQDKLFSEKKEEIQQKYFPEITDAGVDMDFYMNAAEQEVAKEMEGLTGIYQPALQDSYERRVKERFDEKYAQYVMPKIQDITDRMTADIKIELGKVNDAVKRIYNERNETLNREFADWSVTKNKQLSDEFNAKVGSIIEQGVKEKREQSKAYAESMVNLSGRADVLGTAVTGRILGDAFTSAVGSLKNKTAIVLNALGFEADFIDEMRYSGKSMESEYSMEKLPLEQNWMKPGYWAQSLASSAPTMALGMITTALTRNPYVGAVVSYLSESVENSGDVIEGVLGKTGDFNAARLAGGEAFIKNTPTVISDILFQRMFAPLKFAKGTIKEKGKDLGASIIAEGITERWQNSVGMSTGPGAQYTFGRAFASKESVNAQIEGMVSAGILGGGGIAIGGAYKAIFDRKNLPSIRTQAIATTILTNGDDAAKAGAQIDALANSVDDETLALGMKEIEDISKTIQDAQQIGLNPQQTQIFTSLSKELADLNASLSSVTDASVRKALQTQISAKEKEIEGIVSGKTPIATIELQPGLAFTGTIDGVKNVMSVPEVQAEVAAGNVNIITDDAGLNAEVEQMRAAAVQQPAAEAAPARQRNIISDTGEVIGQVPMETPTTEAPITQVQTQQDATQISEGQQQEIPQPSNIVQREGAQEGQPQVGQAEGGIGQATQQAADTRNRPVSSQTQEALKDVESTARSLDVFHKMVNRIKDLSDSERSQMNLYYDTAKENKVRNAKELSEAYHKAKADGSNPELVSAVENLLGQQAPAPAMEATPVEDIMTLDTKDETNLQKVFNWLDNIDKQLDKFGRETAGINLALPVVRAIVKAVKALVQGGMTLQDAIKKAATDNNVTEQDVMDSMKTISNIEKLGLSKQITEAEIPRFNRLMTEIQGIIDKSKERGVDKAGIRENVINYVQGSKAYEDANDLQREQLVRSIDKMFGVKIPSAPRVSRLLGIQNLAKVTMTEKAALKKQLRDATKGAKDAITAWRNASKVLVNDIKNMARAGNISTKQAANIIKKFGKINILSPKSVGKFVDYMTKVFSDAEYENKLSNAKKTRKDISRLSKNKDKNANLTDLGKKFLQVDPSMVEDIDEYNRVAEQVKESIAGSKRKKDEIIFASIANIDDVTAYINNSLDNQNKKIKEETAAEIQELMGIDVSDFSYDDMIALLDKDAEVTKDNESVIRATAKKAFNLYSSIIKKALASGLDPFTEAPFELTETQKELITRFMGMDLDVLDVKDAINAVDALNNFMTNKSTAKMDAVVSDYTGRMNAKKVKEKGIKSFPLKKYFSPDIGRILAEQTTSLGALFERMFVGVKRAGFVQDMFGLTKLMNGKSTAETKANNIAKEYVTQFYSKKANGEVFNSLKNMVERGMIAFLSRNVIGTQAERDAEFNRRRNLVKESIDVLLEGNTREREKGAVYKEIYDKLNIENAKAPEDASLNADKLNVEAVAWWTNKWAEIFPELSDVSQNVYNKILEKDTEYNPDRFRVSSAAPKAEDLSREESAYHHNSGTVYKKETGVLMSATRPETLPLGKRGKPNMYIDLSFDNNNASSMYDALVDIHTASAIRQIDGFLKSKEFDDIFNKDDRKLLEERIDLYVRKIRNKAPFVDDELEKGLKRLNSLAAVGVGQQLGGLTQPPKQVIPVIVNTLINAQGFDIGGVTNKDKAEFIDRAGYSISNRGAESQAQIDSINRIIEIAASGTTQKFLRGIEKINNLWLKSLLVKWDSWVARASWITYYQKSLKEQGIDPNTIDWKTHEVNEEAGNYAQRMVDRQQNISDPAQAGALFADSDNSFKNFIVKTAMPFASFRINQATRLANDISALSKWSAVTKEDRAIALRSVGGFAAEMATFSLISAGLSYLIGNVTNYIMGEEEDEKENEKRKENLIRGQATRAVSDILSPNPIFDKAIQFGVYTLADDIQTIVGVVEDKKVNIFEPKPTEFFEGLGLLGITGQRAAQLVEMGDLAILDGSFEDRYGNQRFLTEKDKESVKMLITPALLSSLGILPSEANSIARKGFNNAKKRALTEKQMKAGGKGKGMKKSSGFGSGGFGSGGFGSGGGFGKGGF